MVRWIGCFGLLLAALAGCGGENAWQPAAARGGDAAGTRPLQVIATVGMVADLVEHVGGPHVAVRAIMGPGVDPHLYKPTRDDVQTILAADVVFYSGLLLEGKMSDTLVKIGRSKPVFAVTERIPEQRLLAPEGAGGHYDPHVWMDVEAWALGVDAVAEALSEINPAHAADYAQNARTYRAELARLHAYGQQVLATIPAERRVLITSHDAFNYFGRAYGLEVLGVQGLSTESETGLQWINELVDLLVSRQIPAVFVESSVSRKNIDALVEGARGRGHVVQVGAELYSDAMGAAGTYEGTYLGMLDHNITQVARGLGGTAPARGMDGKLPAAD